jgi:LPS sulfotransferase NodH
VFDVIERLHLEGDDYVKEAATVGMLEGIQNVAGNSGVNPEEFFRYLKPESVEWWRQWNDFWDGRMSNVGASPNEA